MLGWTVIPRVLGVSPHGIGIAIGYFVGTFVMARRARTRNFDEDHVWNAALWGMFGAIVGARVAYIIGHFDQFASLLDMLKIWEGGISLVGGLMGGIGAGFLYCKRKGLSFLALMDLAAPGLGIGIALGRSGDLVIGDHLGKQTDGWWGWRYGGGELISPPPCVTPDGQPVYASADGCIEPGMVVHQTALYDMVWSLVIFGILVLIVDRRPRPRGFMFFSWGVLYALGRVATDFMRVDKTWFGLGLTGSQLTSIAFILLAAIYMLRSRAPVAAVGGTHAAVIHDREDEPSAEEPYESLPVTGPDTEAPEQEREGEEPP